MDREPRQFKRGPGRSPDLSHRPRDLTDTIRETRRHSIPMSKKKPPTNWVEVVDTVGDLPDGDPGSESGGITPVFKNSWGNSPDPGAEPVAFRLNLMGDVDIKGAAVGGSNGSIVFYLPDDVTPTTVETRIAVGPDGNLIQYVIYTNSAVTATVIDASGGSLAIPGATGPTGYTGPTGSPGGATGPPGPTGPAGAGSTGPQGAPGQKGATGDPGGATGDTGPTGPPGATGPPGGATGPQGQRGATGASGPAGGAITIEYQVDTSSTADSDPGISTLRFNNATQNLTTVLRVSRRDIFNSDWYAILNGLTGGRLRLAKENNLGHWIVFIVTSIAYVGTGNGYFNISVTVEGSSSSNPFLLGDVAVFAYTPAGSDSGATGASGPPGDPGGATGPTGDSGPSGSSGTPGPTGPSGPPGTGGATGATGPPGSAGTQGPTGAGQSGATGPEGGAVKIDYIFDTTTTDSDPGSGKLRLDNATQNAATTIRADELDTATIDWSAVLATFADSTNTVKAHIRLHKLNDLTNWLLFYVTALASPAGYYNISVTVVGSSSANPFSNGDAIVLDFTRNGDKGSTGSQGATGSQGPSGPTGPDGGAGSVGATGPTGVNANADDLSSIIAVELFS